MQGQKVLGRNYTLALYLEKYWGECAHCPYEVGAGTLLNSGSAPEVAIERSRVRQFNLRIFVVSASGIGNYARNYVPYIVVESHSSEAASSVQIHQADGVSQ